MKTLPVYVAITAWMAMTGCENKSASEAVTPSVSPQQKQRVPVLNTLPRFSLKSEKGKAFGTHQLDGKVWIATFLCTDCKQSCPAMAVELARLQKEFQHHPSRDDIHFVTITAYPERDTPEVLRKFASELGADPSRWTFLTNKRENLWKLCNVGFMLPELDPKKNPQPLEIPHSKNLLLIDRARRIRGTYNGLDSNERLKFKRDLELVLEDPAAAITRRKEEIDYTITGSRGYWPHEILHPPWLKERAEAQEKTVSQFQIFHDFQFTDRLVESGITFVNRVVDDAGRYYKGVHYDHGNGMAVADVDGDGLHDIYFVTQLGANQLARNLGGGKFRDITRESGVTVADRIGVTASFADIDNDGDPDLHVTTVRGGNLMFENDGKGQFKDISKSSGLGYNGHSSSAVFFDFDRDGLLDLFLTNPGKYTTNEIGPGGYYIGYVDAFAGHLDSQRTERSILFKNIGNNRFEDVSKTVDLMDTSWTGAASPMDVNEDGWPDLYVVNMQGHDEYYENDEGELFVKSSRKVFPRTPWGSMGIKSFDFDNDGRMDIFITDMHTDMVDDIYGARRQWHAEKMKMTDKFSTRYLNSDDNHVLGNAFFHNQGDGNFLEISDAIGAESYWPWGLSVGDLNADGFDDVFITACMNYAFRYAVNSVLLNNRDKQFLDSEFILGVEPRRNNRTCTPWFVLDCDEEDREHEICKGRHGRIEMWGALGSRSSAIFDLDNDGDLDIVTNDFNSEPMVLISNLTERKPDIRFLKVKLIGTMSNRNGLGARVRVTVGTQNYVKVQDGQSGYLSQSLIPLYFGLGKGRQVDEIEISWPSGGRQVIKGPIQANQLLVITEKK